MRTWWCPWIGDASRPVDAALVAELRAIVEEFAPDEAVILTSFHQSPLPLALLLRLCGVERITGASVDFAGALLDVRLVPGETLEEDQPEPERALAIAAAAGFTMPRATTAGSACGARAPCPPRSRGSARTWSCIPEQQCRPGCGPRRARARRRAAGRRGPRGRRHRRPGASVPSRADVAGARGVDLGGATDFAGAAEVLAGADVVISGNTGPAHLAAAVGTPVVSLFAPVVPAVRWAPYGVPVVLLGDQEAPCAGSRAQVCPVPGHPCLTGVSAEEAVAAALRLRQTTAPREAMA
ncbi:Glycosyltransferase family 9 (heptosyltransferase) [Rathayibacter tanaceti]|uniref:Glycosyltransferase family 9 (Heptosyltransferase) n=1 Tax=Rathayibacter tanaceti TaxID=1671680 RepID=A0A162GEF0_9MICO|nr:Glycosyltransferase family 9 (heptosyltransferase) [Rathayibacter tanaceti]